MTPIVHVLGIIPESKTTLNNLTYKDTVLFKYSLIISSMPVQGIQSGPVPGTFTRLRSWIVPVLHTHFSPYSFFPPEKWVYTSFSPGKISIYSFFPPERSVYTHLSPWFLRGKSEYILKFPPHTQFSPFALIDYTRAITPIRGRCTTSTLWRLL